LESLMHPTCGCSAALAAQKAERQRHEAEARQLRHAESQRAAAAAEADEAAEKKERQAARAEQRATEERQRCGIVSLSCHWGGVG
jgi:DNA repair exonuclease SbcCD ATPase subunit